MKINEEPVIVLYHSACTDGFCSAWLLQLYYLHIDRQNVEYLPVQYGHDAPDVTGKHVIIVDFSFKPEVFDVMRKIALSVTMLDHHAGVFEEHMKAAGIFTGKIADFLDRQPASEKGCYSYRCMCLDKSGAGLTLDWILNELKVIEFGKSYFFDDRLIRVVRAVQDRDLWKFELPDTREIKELLSSIPSTFDAWNDLILNREPGSFERDVEKAGHYLFIKNKLAEDYAAKAQYVLFDETPIWVVNCPANFASDVGHILGKKAAYALTYVSSINRVYVSLRSNTDTGSDVSAIARKFGGNGHVHASGFVTSPEKFFKLFTYLKE